MYRTKSFLSHLATAVVTLVIFGSVTVHSEAEKPDKAKEMAREIKSIHATFKKAGLTKVGTWKDSDLEQYARAVYSLPLNYTPEEALKQCELMYKDMSAKDKLQILLDDLVLMKGRILVVMKRWEEAREAFEQIHAKWPHGQNDLFMGRALCVPSLSVEEQTAVVLTSRYCIKHAGCTADTASLGIAQCEIGAGEYEAAIRVLRKLIPADGKLMSEDPLVREPVDGYLRFFDQTRFRELVARRSDKIALLLVARCQVAMGKEQEAENLYKQHIEFFPCSALEAVGDMQKLRMGNKKDILRSLSKSAQTPELAMQVQIPTEELAAMLKLTDKSDRIAAAKKYFIGVLSSAANK